MRHLAAVATIAVLSALSTPAALGQAGGGTMGTKAGEGSAMSESAQGSHNRMHSREHADARECLRFVTNVEVIRCAEKYLHR